MNATRTLVWNGPLGRFETAALRPRHGGGGESGRSRDQRRASYCRWRAAATRSRRLAHAGVEEDFTYVSTAGGAFLEWLEGKELPGVEALKADEVREGR